MRNGKEYNMKKMTQVMTALLLPLSLVLSGCSEPQPRNKAVYMLVDISGSYIKELEKAEKLSSYLLNQLDSGDSIALATIDSKSFTQKNMIAQTTFEDRPSMVNQQKQQVQHLMQDFRKRRTHGSAYTDISGGVLQAAQHLQNTQAGEKYLILFSDLAEDLPHDHTRDFSIKLDGINVVAINVTKLSTDNLNPQDYVTRISDWKDKVEDSGGQWRLINDWQQADQMLVVN